jgi:hypothetical protein
MEAMNDQGAPDFDPSKKYPVLSYTYSGAPLLVGEKCLGRHTATCGIRCSRKRATSYGSVNIRSRAAKEQQSVWPIYKNKGPLELRDLEDGFAYLKSQPYVDGDRIGLWGWSFGGFMTSYALTHSHGLSKMGDRGRHRFRLGTSTIRSIPSNAQHGPRPQDTTGEGLLTTKSIPSLRPLATTRPARAALLLEPRQCMGRQCSLLAETRNASLRSETSKTHLLAVRYEWSTRPSVTAVRQHPAQVHGIMLLKIDGGLCVEEFVGIWQLFAYRVGGHDFADLTCV